MSKIFIGIIDFVVIFIIVHLVYEVTNSWVWAVLGGLAIGGYSMLCFTDGFNRASRIYEKHRDWYASN